MYLWMAEKLHIFSQRNVHIASPLFCANMLIGNRRPGLTLLNTTQQRLRVAASEVEGRVHMTVAPLQFSGQSPTHLVNSGTVRQLCVGRSRTQFDNEHICITNHFFSLTHMAASASAILLQH
jgi:hypothetical protein